ncbi:hypothetical protein [Streptomyces graminilatus]|uniref:hypothetical protein n=1 Tax=Streptomyces graminilatus TaxID=1464070 RepID=UPI0006E21B6F|nr:hypothetical protein [Streptomyces graminilatus]
MPRGAESRAGAAAEFRAADETTDPIAFCPLDVLRETMESVAEAGRVFSAGLAAIEPATLPTSLGQSLTSVIEANGALFEQLTRFSRRSAQPASSQTTRDGAPGAAPGAHAVVLRGSPGETIAGAFLLENVRDEAITATPLPTAFVDPSGARVDVELRLEPAQLALGPGEQAVVAVEVVVPDRLTAVGEVRGAVHVPGLTASIVPVVITG